MKSADQELVRELAVAGARATALRDDARRITLLAVHRAARAGLSQRTIGHAIGRSQPEVSRLLGLDPTRFKATSPLGELLERHRDKVIAVVVKSGARNVRVFGSVARGVDTPASDIDLLIDIPSPFSLFDLERLRLRLVELLGHEVDLVPARGIQGEVARRAIGEAVAL